ncbi:unnamed protein product [Closterium sp. NIES-64]|nr:unnamed protein product [Closterium sp. NIES-64]
MQRCEEQQKWLAGASTGAEAGLPAATAAEAARRYEQHRPEQRQREEAGGKGRRSREGRRREGRGKGGCGRVWFEFGRREAREQAEQGAEQESRGGAGGEVRKGGRGGSRKIMRQKREGGGRGGVGWGSREGQRGRASLRKSSDMGEHSGGGGRGEGGVRGGWDGGEMGREKGSRLDDGGEGEWDGVQGGNGRGGGGGRSGVQGRGEVDGRQVGGERMGIRRQERGKGGEKGREERREGRREGKGGEKGREEQRGEEKRGEVKGGERKEEEEESWEEKEAGGGGEEMATRQRGKGGGKGGEEGGEEQGGEVKEGERKEEKEKSGEGDELPEGLPLTHEGVRVLGSPVGSQSFCSDLVRSTLTDAAAPLGSLASIHPQHTLLLLSRCVSRRIGYLLRATPADVLPLSEWHAWCSELLNTALTAASIHPPRREAEFNFLLRQATLPVALGGLGLTDPTTEAAPAYLASTTKALRLLRSLDLLATAALGGNSNALQPSAAHSVTIQDMEGRLPPLALQNLREEQQTPAEGRAEGGGRGERAEEGIGGKRCERGEGGGGGWSEDMGVAREGEQGGERRVKEREVDGRRLRTSAELLRFQVRAFNVSPFHSFKSPVLSAVWQRQAVMAGGGGRAGERAVAQAADGACLHWPVSLLVLTSCLSPISVALIWGLMHRDAVQSGVDGARVGA